MRTYSARHSRPSSSPSRLSTSPLKRKLPLEDSTSQNVSRPTKRVRLPNSKKLTQLHFCVDKSVLRTCPRCDLSYTTGAVDDEALHRAHCARIQRGLEWGREEERDNDKAGLIQLETAIRLKDGTRGRIVCFRADAGGKIGSKLTTLLGTINLALSSPPLAPSVLQASKAYLFLIPGNSNAAREKIVGCVIAQSILTAMAVASPAEAESAPNLVSIDPSASLLAHPTPLPTPLGIPRMFVPRSHRRLGIATRLLSCAAKTFVRGCALDPTSGQIAFTQPTGIGAAVMINWTGGRLRVYDEQKGMMDMRRARGRHDMTGDCRKASCG